MKKFRKIMAVLVAAVMIVAMTVPAFAATTYNLYKNVADVETAANVTSDDGKVPTPPADFTKAGYVFDKWTDNKDGTGTAYQPGDAYSGENHTLYAQWRQIQEGRLDDSYATITIANAKAGETYTAYKLFDLASFRDTNAANTEHYGVEADGTATEWYSYVIREYLDDANTTANPWWTFLTTSSTSSNYQIFGRHVTGSIYAPWAVSDSNVNIADLTDNQKYAIFYYSEEEVTLTGRDGNPHKYHIIYANPNLVTTYGYFDNDNDDPVEDNPTLRGIEDGNKGIDYVDSTTPHNKLIQDFAQQALKFANNANYDVKGWSHRTNDKYIQVAESDNNRYTPADNTLKLVGQYTVAADPVAGTAEVADDDNASLGYYLVGSTMGRLASLDTTNKTVLMYEKNDEPFITKDVLKKGQTAYAGTGTDYRTKNNAGDTYDDSAYWVKNTDANMKDYVMFRTVINVEQGGVDGYYLYDTMEPGLTAPAIGSDSNPFAVAPIDYGYRVYLERDRDGAAGSADEGKTITDFYYIPESFGNVTDTNSLSIPASSNYSYTRTNDYNCTFVITFNDANETLSKYLDQVNLLAQTAANEYTMLDVKDGDRIVVYYYAQLNEGAKIFGNADEVNKAEVSSVLTETLTSIKANDGTTPLDTSLQRNYVSNGDQRNNNYTILTYGDTSYTSLETASVTTYQFDIVKTRNDKNDANNWELLDGATFKLYKVVDEDDVDFDANGIAAGDNQVWELNSVKYMAVKKGLLFENPKSGVGVTPAYDYTAPKYLYKGDVLTAAQDGGYPANGTTLTSVADAAINVSGLEAGTYLIEEIQAPMGYDKLANPIVVKINADLDWDGDWEDDKFYEASDPEVLAGTKNVGDLKGEYEGSINRIMVHNNGAVEQDTAGNAVAANAHITTTAGKYYYDKTGTEPIAVPENKSSTRKLMGLQIINTTGEELPSTGGMGTTVLYIVGGMMVLLAGAYLFFNRKRNAA